MTAPSRVLRLRAVSRGSLHRVAPALHARGVGAVVSFLLFEYWYVPPPAAPPRPPTVAPTAAPLPAPPPVAAPIAAPAAAPPIAPTTAPTAAPLPASVAGSKPVCCFAHV